MNKLEKNYIKKTVEKILKIEAEALQYTDGDFYEWREVRDFAEETYGKINHYINRMVDRCVKKNVVNQLVDLNIALYERNTRLKPMYGYNYKY